MSPVAMEESDGDDSSKNAAVVKQYQLPFGNVCCIPDCQEVASFFELIHSSPKASAKGEITSTNSQTTDSSSEAGSIHPRDMSFRSEGSDKTLLHGLLHVKIIQARGLRNLDGFRGFNGHAPKFLSRDVSDPYVIVNGGRHRFVKTRVINNDLNPVWNEDFYVPVAHYLKSLMFEVRDDDFNVSSELMGKVEVPITDLLKFDENFNPMRVGVHKVAFLDGKKNYGSLEFLVEFIPPQMTASPLEVPGVYFKQHEGNRVKLYVNADDGEHLGTPPVTYGGPNDDQKVWKPARLWRDIYDSICDAKHFIYITGWAVDYTQSLLRGHEREAALAGPYSPYIGELLKTKAEEGVVVNMLVWDDASSTFAFPGMMGTHDEESRMFFQNSKVTFRLAPMLGGEENNLHQKAGKFVMFTHHQKTVILDAATPDGRGREPLAYVGGIDLTDGRWDNVTHPLFRTLETDHKGDTYNGCFAVNVAEVGPREPWHDIHSCIRGPGALDVIKNFTERWYKQASDAVGELVDLNALGFHHPPVSTSQDRWCSQVFRSIDSRTAHFDKGRLGAFTNEHVDDIKGVEFTEESDDSRDSRGMSALMKKAKKKAGAKYDRAKEKFDEHRVRTRTFECTDASKFRFVRDLLMKKGRNIDASVHTAMVHHIRRAEHVIYIESQYFLGSSHMWTKNDGTKCGNLVASEIMIKICEKIEARERFAAYILLPMWPEGIPESGSVQAILRWQRLTMESMYRRIALSLRNSGTPGHPRDWLNFYCLATRESPEGDQASHQPTANTIEETLNNTRRHQVYVHSKMLIIDDTVALIGSANINQRSLDGARDSEILLGAWQPEHVATKELGIPHGDVHGFRMHCWASVMDRMEDVFRNPSDVECVHRVNEIAEHNWQMFASDDLSEMSSNLVPYPIEVSMDGKVEPRSDLPNGFFPDTKAKVTGTKSATLPEILTT